MAFFKFRKNGDEHSPAPVQPESVEALRRRAKFRLIGAVVLVLLGVVGFPLLFDKQPRPIAVDMPIEIPDRNKAKPLSIPPPMAIPSDQPGSAARSLPAAPAQPATPAATAATQKLEEIVTQAPVFAAPDAAKIIAKSEPKAVDKPAEKPSLPPVNGNEQSRAQALLEGRDPEKKLDAGEGRYVVQVGAFSDATRAREVRLKVEHAGLKTYTQVAETKDGRRIRVRVGPFSVKAEADKAAEKIKKLDLPAAILTL